MKVELKDVFSLRKELFFTVFGIFFLCLVLVPLFIVCFFNHPQSLDNFRVFSVLSGGRDAVIGAIQSIKLLRRHITFFSNLLWLIPKNTNVDNYNVIVLIYRIHAFFIISFFSFSFFFLFKNINDVVFKVSNSVLLLCYGLYLYFIIQSLTRIDLFFYEMITTFGYTLGLSLCLLFITFLIKSYSTSSIRYTIWECILIFLICGCIEFYTVFSGYVCFLFLVSHFIFKKKISIKYSIYLGIFILVFLYLLLGNKTANASKIAGYSGNVSNPYSLSRFIIWNRDFINIFFMSFRRIMNIFSLIIIIPCAYIFSSTYRVRRVKFALFLILSNYLLGSIIAFSIFVTGIICIEWAPSMIQIPIFIIVVNTLSLIFFVVNILFHNFRIVRKDENCKFSSLKSLFFYNKCLFFLIGMLYVIIYTFALKPSPVRTSWADVIKGRAKDYDTQIFALYDQIKKSEDDVVIVKEIKPVPRTLITSDKTSNLWSVDGTYSYQKDYYTNALASFFHKKDIIIVY